jgi:hypothetical protein
MLGALFSECCHSNTICREKFSVSNDIQQNKRKRNKRNKQKQTKNEKKRSYQNRPRWQERMN